MPINRYSLERFSKESDFVVSNSILNSIEIEDLETFNEILNIKISLNNIILFKNKN